VYNTNATYPDCCGKVVCDSVEGNEIDVGKYMHKLADFLVIFFFEKSLFYHLPYQYNFLFSADDYGHYDEYMMSTYDAPNFLAPAEELSHKPTSSNVADEAAVEDKLARKVKLSQLQKLPAYKDDVITSDQLFTILLPNSYHSSNSLGGEAAAAKSGNSGASVAADLHVVDYDLELPKPMKSATVFDYHEVSLEDYDWDRIFGEAAAAAAAERTAAQ
jgi:hypothetical protein